MDKTKDTKDILIKQPEKDVEESEEHKEAREIVFQHAIMTQVCLPRKDCKERIFERRFKNASICVEAGRLWDGVKWQEQPIPYGVKPRLALLYINSQAIKTGSPEIDIGRSYAEFCERLNLSKGGRAFYELKKQMNALAACRMSFGFTYPDGLATTLPDIKPVARFDAWLVKEGKQQSLWPASLRLGAEYMDSLLKHAVPLPVETIFSLKESALALDLLSFFARRLQSLSRPVRVPFVLFKEQFGQEYKDVKPFKAKFLKAVREVLTVYPCAGIEQVRGGLVLKPSPPLVGNSKQATVIYTPDLSCPVFVPQELTDKTRDSFKEICSRLDIYACKADFDAWVQKRDTPKDYQRAFLGFAQKWKVGKH